VEVINRDMGETWETMVQAWPIVFGFVTLVIVLAKMHGQIEVLQDKVKTLFDLWNSRPK